MIWKENSSDQTENVVEARRRRRRRSADGRTLSGRPWSGWSQRSIPGCQVILDELQRLKNSSVTFLVKFKTQFLSQQKCCFNRRQLLF